MVYIKHGGDAMFGVTLVLIDVWIICCFQASRVSSFLTSLDRVAMASGWTSGNFLRHGNGQVREQGGQTMVLLS